MTKSTNNQMTKCSGLLDLLEKATVRWPASSSKRLD